MIMGQPGPVLATQGLTAGYDHAVFSGLDLTLSPGALTAILGANGSGKSTLLRTLARLHTQQSGVVSIDGVNVADARPRAFAKEVGMLSQHPIAPEGITVRELVMRGRYPHQPLVGRTSAAEGAIVSEVIERTGLADIAERRVHQLSGGQRQRAWIAMALAQQPRILLLDEPTTFLDLAHQLEVLELLRAVNREQGITMVMVLHELNLAARFCDEFILLAHGGVLAQGSAEAVLTAPHIRVGFDIEAHIAPDPVTGRPMVIPVRHL